MLLSMTGFGEARHQQDGLVISVEIRAINSRYFKLTCRTSDGYGGLESEIENALRGLIKRGTVQVNLRVERTASPEQFRLNELVRRRLTTLEDPREVVTDPNARYSGVEVSEKTLLPGNNALLGETRFEVWLTQSEAQIPGAHPQPTGVPVVKESQEKAS